MTGTGLALEGKTCVVTGASSGIGRATAVALAAAGATVYAVARRREELDVTASLANGVGQIVAFDADLTVDERIAALTSTVLADRKCVDVLVHSAGTISLGHVDTAAIDDLDRQYAANVRAPYLLTQALLPALRAGRGQIVFINSTVGLVARANVSQFAATQHALKAVADSLREEVNPDGIRVMSVYPGRTATPRQAKIHEAEGKVYSGERLVQPEDIATLVRDALTLPRSAELTDLKVRPMLKH